MRLRPDSRAAYGRELRAAVATEHDGDLPLAFRHLERAHILGQRNTWAHTRAHWRMLRFGWRHRDRREVLGQSLRIVAALTKSMLWMPAGNTGGANVNPFQPMPIPDDLRRYLE